MPSSSIGNYRPEKEDFSRKSENALKAFSPHSLILAHEGCDRPSQYNFLKLLVIWAGKYKISPSEISLEKNLGVAAAWWRFFRVSAAFFSVEQEIIIQ